MMSVYTAHDLLSRQFFRRSNLSLRFTTYTPEAFDTALLSSFTAALNSNSELKLTADVSVRWAELELFCCIFDCYSIHVYMIFLPSKLRTLARRALYIHSRSVSRDTCALSRVCACALCTAWNLTRMNGAEQNATAQRGTDYTPLLKEFNPRLPGRSP